MDHDSPLEEVFEDQLACADMVVVSKSDLLEEGDAEAVIAKIRQETRQSVKTLTAYHGKVDAALLLGLDAAVEDDVDKKNTP